MYSVIGGLYQSLQHRQDTEINTDNMVWWWQYYKW